MIRATGCALTCWALLGASRSIRAGDHNKTNRMFRARILAQGFTLVAMVAGSMYWESDRRKRKEFEGAVSERKAKEKNAAWIKELEARDVEEKEIRALREKRMRREQVVPGGMVENVKRRVQDVEERVEGEVEKIEEKGKSWWGGSNAKSMIDEREARKVGVLEAVQELLLNEKK